MYDVDYFINKFEAIPEKNWTTIKLSDGQGACCALGHCGVTANSNGEYVYTDEAEELIKLFGGSSKHNWQCVSDINDLYDPHSAILNTSKKRILNKLYKIKSQGGS